MHDVLGRETAQLKLCNLLVSGDGGNCAGHDRGSQRGRGGNTDGFRFA